MVNTRWWGLISVNNGNEVIYDCSQWLIYYRLVKISQWSIVVYYINTSIYIYILIHIYIYQNRLGVSLLMFTDSHSLFWVEVHYVDRHQKMRFEYEKGTKDQEVHSAGPWMKLRSAGDSPRNFGTRRFFRQVKFYRRGCLKFLFQPRLALYATN